MPLQKKLEELNIPEREAQVYLVLLKLGLTAVGPIVTHTKLHRMLVYQALERLKDSRMASMVMKNGRQHWQATSPSMILERVTKQQKLAKDLVGELELLREKSHDDVSIEIFYGRNGLIESLEESIKSAARTDHIVRILGGANDKGFYDLINDWYPEYLELQKRLKVSKRLIAPVTHTESFDKHFKNEPGNEFRLWSSGLSSPTFTRMTQEMVSIEVYGLEPVIIIMKNDKIAQAYIESFELLWKESTN